MEVQEIFKDIPNYEGLYQVSNLGNVKSLERQCNHWCGGLRFLKERILKKRIDANGYIQVYLSKNGIMKPFKVHQLVAIEFLNHIPCGYELVVNHKNFNKLDNRVENLEIITTRENTNKKHLKSSSKYIGVCWDKQRKKWIASITINGKLKYLGRFINEYDANLAYQNKLKTL